MTAMVNRKSISGRHVIFRVQKLLFKLTVGIRIVGVIKIACWRNLPISVKS